MSLTKKDLQNIGELIDSKLESKLEEKLESKFESKFKPIKQSLKKIEDKLDLTIRTFDRDFNYHHRRLTNLEDKVGIKAPPVIPPIN